MEKNEIIRLFVTKGGFLRIKVQAIAEDAEITV